MFPLLWALLLPFPLSSSLKVDITNDTPGAQWSLGWSSVTGSQCFSGTLMSVADGGATLTYKFTGRLPIIFFDSLDRADVVTCFQGTKISVYGTEGTGSRSKRANSSYTLDGVTTHFHQESVTTSTPDVLFYSSPTLEDTQHTLLIQNFVSGGGKVVFLVQFKSRALTPKLDAELQLDYFEVTGGTIKDIQLTSNRKYTTPRPASQVLIEI